MPHQIDSNIAKQVSDALDTAGIGDAVKPFVLSQAAYETNGFMSNVSLEDNNYSGIKYFGSDPNYLGIQSDSADGSHYRRFNSPVDWATYMISVLSQDNGQGAPIDSNSIVDYATRLKANGYFEDTLSNYLGGLKSFYNSISLTYPALFLVSTLSELSNDALNALGFSGATSVGSTTSQNTTHTIGLNVIVAGAVILILLASVFIFFRNKRKQ